VHAGDDPLPEADTASIFASWEEWEEAHSNLEAEMDRYAALGQPTLSSAEALLTILEARQRVLEAASDVNGYLHIKQQLNRGDEEAIARQRQFSKTIARWGELDAWFGPAILQLNREQLDSWTHEERFAEFSFPLRERLRATSRVLPAREEELLTLAVLGRRNSQNVYRALNQTEGPKREIELLGGGRFEITPGSARSMLESLSDPADRHLAWKTWLDALGARASTHAALLTSVAELAEFEAKARGFDGVLEQTLYEENIPRAVLTNLFDTARRETESLQRHHRIRAELLGLETYSSSDRFVQLEGLPSEIPFATARSWILAAVQPLGDEVVALCRRAFEEGWIDAVERTAKAPVASATYVHGEHPFVLLQYRGTGADVFRLMHELGHAVHSQLSHEAQPFGTSRPSPLVAEAVAALFEALLLDHLAQVTTGPEKLAVLDLGAQILVKTFYRPAMDAEFEHRAHKGEVALTATGLSEAYREILSHYLGEAVQLQPWDGVSWLAVPHYFNSPLSMFRYGLSFSAGVALADSLTQGSIHSREQARARVIALLRSGGNGHAVELLARAGADLEDPLTVQSVPRRLDSLSEQTERELASNRPAPQSDR